jgi:uncharacterized protein YndB with AHSA1/START domain
VTLPTDRQIRVVREFDAPRSMVWRAYTTPELVRRWWHAGRGEMTVCEIDLRVGGAWRYAMVTPDGTEVAFHGEYLEVEPERRLVSRELYEGVPPGVSEADATTTNTAVLTEPAPGRTVLEILVEAANRTSRDAIIDSGMEDGLQDALDLLEREAAA